MSQHRVGRHTLNMERSHVEYLWGLRKALAKFAPPGEDLQGALWQDAIVL